MKRSTGLKRTPLRKVSKKRAKQNRLYSSLIKQLKKDHPTCEGCGKKGYVDVHHRLGRSHDRLLDPDNFLYLCRNCHQIMHHDQAAMNNAPLSLLSRLAWLSSCSRSVRLSTSPEEVRLHLSLTSPDDKRVSAWTTITIPPPVDFPKIIYPDNPNEKQLDKKRAL